MIRIFYLIFLLFISTSSLAEFTFNQNCKKSYTHIFNLEYEKADYLIKVEKLYNPSNPSIIFLQSGISFMRSILEEDPEAIKEYFKLHDEFVLLLDKTGENNSEIQWLLSETYFHSALINFKIGNYMKGAWQLRKSFKIAENNEKANVLSFKITGLTESFLGTIPDEYQWALKIFGMNGDLNSGKNKLYKLLNESSKNHELNFIFNEMIFYTAFVEHELLKDEKQALKILHEHKETLNRPFGAYIQGLIYLKTGKSKQAEKILSEELKHNDQHPYPYLYYMLGLSKLQNLHSNTEIYFQKYLRHYKGKHYVKAVYQKLAWAELIKGNEKNYRKYMEELSAKGNTQTDDDRQAQGEAEQNEIPDVNLLRARLLFDGGNYTAAEKILEQINPKNLNSKNFIEFHYRYGRIKQEQIDHELAEFYFVKVISLQGDQHLYFAPNSALQIAMSAEEKKNFKKAEEFYKKAYSYKKYEYKNSIQQKVKAGLERIKHELKS